MQRRRACRRLVHAADGPPGAAGSRRIIGRRLASPGLAIQRLARPPQIADLYVELPHFVVYRIREELHAAFLLTALPSGLCLWLVVLFLLKLLCPALPGLDDRKQVQTLCMWEAACSRLMCQLFKCLTGPVGVRARTQDSPSATRVGHPPHGGLRIRSHARCECIRIMLLRL